MNPKIGVIGAGQLGRMLALAGGPLDLRLTFLDPSEHPSAASFGRHIRAQFDDELALRRLADGSDLITYEFENVAVDSLERLSSQTKILPTLSALRIAQERRSEKRFFEHIGLPVAPWAFADSQSALQAALQKLRLPVIVKTNRFGYDGKGQRVLGRVSEARGVFDELGGVAVTLEEFVDFDYEVSIIGTRDASGNVKVYALTQNEHRDGILHESRPLPDNHHLAADADRHLRALTAELDYVGTVAIEFFVARGRLVANEFAPRVHNSGHWTIEAAATSQFENHLRAISGLPLGSCETLARAAMRNLIGSIPDRRSLLAIEGLHLHDYGKAPRALRKVGHTTIVAATDRELDSRLRALTAVTDSM